MLLPILSRLQTDVTLPMLSAVTPVLGQVPTPKLSPRPKAPDAALSTQCRRPRALKKTSCFEDGILPSHVQGQMNKEEEEKMGKTESLTIPSTIPSRQAHEEGKTPRKERRRYFVNDVTLSSHAHEEGGGSTPSIFWAELVSSRGASLCMTFPSGEPQRATEGGG